MVRDLSFDEVSIVPLSGEHLKLREDNLRRGHTNIVLEWKYDTKQFEFVQIMPDFNIYMKSALYLIRKMRQQVLLSTDNLEFGATPFISDEVKNEIVQYRQALRDITDQELLLDANNLAIHFEEHESLPTIVDFFPTPPQYIANIVNDIVHNNYYFSEEEMASFK